MCGICGIVDPSKSIATAELQRMADSMRHRGPDADGVWVSPDRGFGFGHRRLSIIDLDARSNQPFLSDDGMLALTFNGEIYNFLEIKHELETKGHHFRTQSDTEMILHAYAEWGTDCVRRFRGMFAFGLADLRHRRLWLVRDRLGKKPLLYYRKDDLLMFASEFAALVENDRCDSEVDLTALYDSLTYFYIPAPKTAYRHIRKVRPGHWLLWENGTITEQKYWDIENVGTTMVDETAAVNRVRELIEDSVFLRMISDVPLGILLSGGLDSSAVAYYAQKRSTEPVHTYSIGFDVEAFDETADAQRVADYIGSQHTVRTYSLSAALTEGARIIHLYGEPHGDVSIFPTTAVCKIAREHVTVALSGDGGDELFWGYNHFRAYLDHDKPAPGLLRNTGSALVRRLLPMGMKGRNFALRYLTADFDLHTATMGGVQRDDKLRLISPDLHDLFRGYDDYWAYREHWRTELPLRSRLQYLDLKTYLAEGVLMKMDRASMSVSLESRAPLLDHVLIEEVFSWPEQIRNNGQTLKYLFKKAMTGILPDAVLQKPKQGFSVPWRHWIRSWEDMRNLTGDGSFFRKNLRLPPIYMVLVLQDWLKKRNSG